MISKKFFFFFALAILKPDFQLALGKVLTLEQSGSDWYQLDSQAGKLIIEAAESRSLIAKLRRNIPNSGLNGQIVLLDVLVRLGHADEAVALIKQPEFLESLRSKKMADAIAIFLIKKQAYAVAKTFLENFPEAEPANISLLICHMFQYEGAANTDKWLFTRMISCKNDFWLEQRLIFRVSQETAKACGDERIIKSQIKTAESKNKESSDYWLGRAEYYVGRNKKDMFVHSFEKAMALCPAKTWQDSSKRSSILMSYITALQAFRDPELDELHGNADTVRGQESMCDRQAAIMHLLKREFDNMNTASNYANTVVFRLLHFEPEKPGRTAQSPILTAQNKKLWQYLKAQNHWDNQITFLLCRLANTVPKDKENQFWMQCAALADNGEAEKSRIIGKAMEQSQRLDLATKLFGQACRQALRTIAVDAILADAQKQNEDELMVNLTRADLFRCFIKSNDWYAAEKVWREDERKASPELRGSYLGQLALAAARAGNKKRAINFWKEKLKWDALNTDSLSEIAKAGLKYELIQIYLALQMKDPKSEASYKALDILKTLPN